MIALPLLRDSKPRQSEATSRASLAVVPRRRRWPALLAGLAWSLVFVGLLGAAVFHTQLAERQLRLDRLDRQVTVERERFDELRYERAELRSPVRLEAVARQLAAAGPIGDSAVRIVIHTDPLDQFRAVKSVTEGEP